MIKILFVCHGNICRSPMAEFVMKDLINKKGLSKDFQIDSAATTTEEIWHGIGNPVYPPAREKLAEHGISCEGKRARLLIKEDYNIYDYIIGMDRENMHDMLYLFPKDPDRKLSLLMDHTSRPRSVADPWYTRNFEATWQDILEGCTCLLDELSNDSTN